MGDEDAFSILEGAAGFDGYGSAVGDLGATFSAPSTDGPQPNDGRTEQRPPVPVPLPPPPPTYVDTVSPAQDQPPPPSAGYGWLSTLVDALCGAAVGYVVAPTPRDRALYAGLGALGGGVGGSLGIGAVGAYALYQRHG